MESWGATHTLYAELTEGAADIPGLLFAHPRQRTLASGVLDAARTDPAGLRENLRRTFPRPNDLALLVAGCGDGSAARCADVRDWASLLHKPMARCFTLLSAAMPLVQRADEGGQAVLVIFSHAVIHDPEHGPGSVLGRGLLGLFEGLAAELRRTATRVTIFLRHESESEQTLRARFADALQRRPLFALPACLAPAAVHNYYRPITAALRATPAGAPLPAGPMGAIYRADVETMGHPVAGSYAPSC